MTKGSQTDSRGMSTTMTALAWIVFMVLVGFYFNELLQKQRNPNQVLQTRYTEENTREVSLVGNKYGHYVTSGQVNGRSVIFMLDTGATGVAIPATIAEKLNIPRGRPVQVQTANGMATSYLTQLDSVSVGDITLYDVDAAIVPGYNSDQILLGMSFLRHIEFTQKGRTLVLKQYYQ
ncbi:MAG: retropepsin-like aspartic protease [Halioglobus sp.]